MRASPWDEGDADMQRSPRSTTRLTASVEELAAVVWEGVLD